MAKTAHGITQITGARGSSDIYKHQQMALFQGAPNHSITLGNPSTSYAVEIISSTRIDKRIKATITALINFKMLTNNQITKKHKVVMRARACSLTY